MTAMSSTWAKTVQQTPEPVPRPLARTMAPALSSTLRTETIRMLNPSDVNAARKFFMVRQQKIEFSVADLKMTIS